MMNEAKFRRLKKKAFFIGVGIALAGPAIAQNENCPNCLLPSTEPFFKSLVSLQAPVMSAINPNLNYPRNNVSSIVTRHLTPMQPVLGHRVGPVVDPTNYVLPGAFNPASVDPTFRSQYWNWNPPGALDLPIWNPGQGQVYVPGPSALSMPGSNPGFGF